MVKITEDLVRKKSEHNELLISTLEELSLHQEDIERIEHFHSWCKELKILLLQSNLIPKIENLWKLKKLEYLNLAINNIERVENLEKLESLNKLDLTLNFIGELTSIESLIDNYNLRELILTGNPCCDYPHYKEYVIATLPQLERLDSEDIRVSEKLQAKQKLKDYRDIIVQHQANYAIKRDEQKIRYQQQKEDLAAKMANIADEEERIKAFWQEKSEHCPEIRADIAKMHKDGKKQAKNTDADINFIKKKPQLFAPCGRPYNLNQAKLKFALKDERSEYVLELDVYKYLDSSHINVDTGTNYIRVAVKGKIFQIALSEEVNISEACVKRSQITGQLVVYVPKLNVKEILLSKVKKDEYRFNTENNKRSFEPTGSVNIRTICAADNTKEMPDLI